MIRVNILSKKKRKKGGCTTSTLHERKTLTINQSTKPELFIQGLSFVECGIGITRLLHIIFAPLIVLIDEHLQKQSITIIAPLTQRHGRQKAMAFASNHRICYFLQYF